MSSYSGWGGSSSGWGSSSGGWGSSSRSNPRYQFERDLALVQARRRRLNQLRLTQKPKQEEDTWFLDRLIPDVVEKGVDQIATSLINTPAGLYQMGKSTALDVRDLAGGDFTPERTAGMFGQMGTAMYEDFRHPLRNPGYLAMDLFALGSMGLGTAARVGAAAGKYGMMTRTGSAANRAMIRMGEATSGMPRTTSGALFHAVPPSMRPSFGRSRGLQEPTVPEAHAATGAVETINPLKAISQRYSSRKARQRMASLERLIATRPENPYPTQWEQGELRSLRRQAGIQDEGELARQADAAGLAEASQRYEAALPALRAEDEARQAARAEREAAYRAAQQESAQARAQPPMSPLAAQQSARQVTAAQAAAPGQQLKLFDQQPVPLTGLGQQLPQLMPGPPVAPMGPLRPGELPGVVTPLGPGAQAQIRMRQTPQPTQPGPLPAVTDPRSQIEKLRDVYPEQYPTPLEPPPPLPPQPRAPTQPRQPGQPARVLEDVQPEGVPPDVMSQLRDLLAGVPAAARALDVPDDADLLAQSEHTFGMIPDEEPPAMGRPKNDELGMSKRQRAIYDQALKKPGEGGLTTKMKDDGSYQILSPRGHVVANVIPKKDKDGKPMIREDSEAKYGRSKKFEFEIYGPGGTHRGEAWLDINRHERAAGDIYAADVEGRSMAVVRRMTAEWLAANKIANNKPKNRPIAQQRETVQGGPFVQEKGKVSKEGDLPLQSAEDMAWVGETPRINQGPELADVVPPTSEERAARMEANQENASLSLKESALKRGEPVEGAEYGIRKGKDGKWEVYGALPGTDIEAVLATGHRLKREAQAEADSLQSAVPATVNLPDELAPLDEIAGPSDAELAAMEAGDLVEDVPGEPVEQKVAKGKAAKGEPLTKEDADALTGKLDPALQSLGLRYNQKGHLSTPEAAELEHAIEQMGFDAGDSFLIADAVQSAAGTVGGKKKSLTTKDFQAALRENYPEPEAFDEIWNKLYGAGGGSGVVWKDVLKAFLAPRVRKSTTLTARLPAMEKGMRVFDEESQEVLMSNNPLVRMAWHTTYGALQAMENPYAKGGAGNWASRQLRRKMAFERGEIKRIEQLGDAAGIPDFAKKYEARVEASKRTDFGSSPWRYWDTTNRVAMMGLLFLKPAYLSANLIGQMGLAMIDHGWNPVNIYRSVKIQNELFRDGELAGSRAARMRGMMGQGAMGSLDTETPGASRLVFNVHDWSSRQYAKLLDTPFRDNAFINEAHIAGHTNAEMIGKLLDAPDGSDLHTEATRIARRANRNLVDFGRLSGIEKQFVRRVIIFYPWLKGATIYGARFAAEHPAQFALAETLGREGHEQAFEDLGQMPSFMEQQGVFKVGDRTIPGLGEVPEVMNPAAISILGTPGEALSMARAALMGNVRQSEELGESLTPAATAALTAFTGTDPFTGAKSDPGDSWLERGVGSLADTLPFFRQKAQLDRAGQIASGEKDPRELLQPMNKQDVIGRWLGPGFGAAVGRPMGEFAVNPREMRSRAEAEARTFQSKRAATIAKFGDYAKLAKSEAKRVGVVLPPQFTKAMSQKAQRAASIAEWEAVHGKDADRFDRLEADMRLLVQRGDYTQERAERELEQFSTMDENAIDRFRRQLGAVYFGGEVTAYYKKLLNAAGAKIDQGW